MADSQGGGSLDWTSMVTSDWLRGQLCHLAGLGHHLSPDCAVPLRSFVSSAFSPFSSKSPTQPYPLGPPMSKICSLWCSAFWIRVNTKWHVETQRNTQDLKHFLFCWNVETAFVSGCFLNLKTNSIIFCQDIVSNRKAVSLFYVLTDVLITKKKKKKVIIFLLG